VHELPTAEKVASFPGLLHLQFLIRSFYASFYGSKITLTWKPTNVWKKGLIDFLEIVLSLFSKRQGEVV